jgi:hypothetical protein
MAEGIEVRVARDGTRTYRASVWSNRDEKRICKSFPSQAAAKAWRSDAAAAADLEIWVGDPEEGVIVLPVAELLDRYDKLLPPARYPLA